MTWRMSNDDEFALHLGQGWYADVNGRFHNQPITAAATYEQPGGLPFDAKAIKDAFNDAKGILPDTNDAKSVAKFRDMGLPEETIKFLGAIGVAAGAAGTALGIVAFLFAAAKFVGLFTDGEDALMKKITAVFKELRAFSRAEGNEARDKMIAEIASELTVALNAVKNYVDELNAYILNDKTELALRRQELRAAEKDAAVAALRATNPLSWTRAFDVDEYTGSWFWVNGWLQVQPQGEPASPYPLPPQADARQDHRIMVPVALYAAQSYLMVIRGISPEFRTTGEFRDNLASLANNFAAMAANMRLQGMAKIVYNKEAFIFPPWTTTVGDENKITAFTHYTVGAVDLCFDTDAFVRTPPFTSQQWLDAWQGKTTLKRGQMEFYWLPSQNKYPPPAYGYENPEQAMADANAKGEHAYAELLLRTGYLQMVHQTMLLRHLSTEPRTSETVTGTTGYAKSDKGSATVTAKSDDIPFTGVLETPATLHRQAWSAHARINTQPLGHQRMIDYRIVLRSLPARTLGVHVDAPDYKRSYEASYENDPARPGFKRLKVDFAATDVRDEIELIRSKSPEDIKKANGTNKLRVDSFDWYVRSHTVAKNLPSALIDGVLADIRDAANSGSAPGFAPPTPPPAPGPRPGHAGPILSNVLEDHATVSSIDAIDAVGWLDSPNVRGERRHLKSELATVNWTLEWNEDRLRVAVDGQPTDRNYVLHLVIEETLISGQRLHTAFPITMNNQITLVPEEFLDREQAAWDHAGRLIDEINHHYAKSVSPVVGGRMPIHVDPTAILSRSGIAEMVAAYEQGAPELLRQVVHDHQR